MADFNTCILFVLKHETFTNSEGKLITLYEDKKTGEVSNYGISMALLKSMKYKIQDPHNLAYADVMGIYQQVFWQPKGLSSISSNLVAQKILDMAVNMKFGEAERLTQASLNTLGFPCVIDGIFGPHTFITLNQAIAIKGELAIVQELAVKSQGYYQTIAPNMINGEVDLPVWLARATDLGINVNYKPV